MKFNAKEYALKAAVELMGLDMEPEGDVVNFYWFNNFLEENFEGAEDLEEEQIEKALDEYTKIYKSILQQLKKEIAEIQSK